MDGTLIFYQFLGLLSLVGVVTLIALNISSRR